MVFGQFYVKFKKEKLSSELYVAEMDKSQHNIRFQWPTLPVDMILRLWPFSTTKKFVVVVAFGALRGWFC